MKRLREILRFPETHALLFSLVFLLLGWPILVSAVDHHDAALFIYLFFVWGVSIAALAVVAVSLGGQKRTGDRGRGD